LTTRARIVTPAPPTLGHVGSTFVPGYAAPELWFHEFENAIGRVGTPNGTNALQPTGGITA